MKVITLANRKGGVGKTTLTFNLGSFYANFLNKKVCFIDLDSQANLTNLCNAEINKIEEFKNIAISNVNDNLDILASSKDFKSLENEADIFYLKDNILPYLKNYDYVLIDTSPSLDKLNLNAFVVSDLVHIIVNCDNFSISSYLELNNILMELKEYNQEIKYDILINNVNARLNISKEILSLLQNIKEYTNIIIPSKSLFLKNNTFKKDVLKDKELYEIFEKISKLI